MTTTAWIFMSVSFAIIVGAAGLSLNKILKNNK